MNELVKKIILDFGADVCGIGTIDRFKDAPKGFSPIDIYSECKSVIAFGVSLPKGIMKVDSRLIYSHFNGPILCQQVDQIALLGAKKIEQNLAGICIPLPCDAPNEYWDKETLTAKGLLSVKHAAVQCGLGQLGKSTLLLNPKYGNLLTIGIILTNLDLKPDEYCENICIQNCTRCIDNCPVKAIKNGSVNQKLCRPNTYGTTARGFETVDCNKCRNLCPRMYGILS